MTVFESRNPWKLGKGRGKEMESGESRDSRSDDRLVSVFEFYSVNINSAWHILCS